MWALRNSLKTKCNYYCKFLHSGPKEVRMPVPWGEIRGKWWGPTDVRPVLTLHGWQDNSGTFDRLIPHLQDKTAFLAIDLPGHGLSSRLPLGQYYHFIDYVVMLHFLIADYFKWPKTTLMGHSLGGIICYIYAMLYPTSVDYLMCLDAFAPIVHRRTNIHMAQSLHNFLKYNKMASEKELEPPSYSLDEIRKKICAPNKNSIRYEFADHLAARGTAESKQHLGKYYFTRDPRVKVAGLVNFSQDQLVEYAQNIVTPICIAKARGGSYYHAKENFYEVLDVVKRSSVDCDFHYVDGTHHVHLNNPEDELVTLLRNFIDRHYVEDKSDGLREEMLVKDDSNVVENRELKFN